MARPGKQLRRLVRFVEALKRNDYPNAEMFAAKLQSLDLAENEDLAVCPKTVRRDIEHLRNHYRIPMDFDRARNGYYLTDPAWTFPFLELRGDELFASLLSGRLAGGILPPSIRESLQEAMAIQLAAGDPQELRPDLLESVILATGVQVPPEPALFDQVIAAWRDSRRLRIHYSASSAVQDHLREVEIHALFLSNHAWYARVFCHLRQGVRSLALHRIRQCEPMAETFQRDQALVREVKSGHVFDYTPVKNVVIRCSAEKAALIREREWFTGQQITVLADDRLELHYPFANRPEILWWVMSYAGHLEVRKPVDLREEVRQTAEVIRLLHTNSPAGKDI